MTLGKGRSAAGLADLQLENRLHHFMAGGGEPDPQPARGGGAIDPTDPFSALPGMGGLAGLAARPGEDQHGSSSHQVPVAPRFGRKGLSPGGVAYVFVRREVPRLFPWE